MYRSDISTDTCKYKYPSPHPKESAPAILAGRPRAEAVTRSMAGEHHETACTSGHACAAEPALQRDCSVLLMTRCGILCGVPDGGGCGRPAWAEPAVITLRCPSNTRKPFHRTRSTSPKNMGPLILPDVVVTQNSSLTTPNAGRDRTARSQAPALRLEASFSKPLTRLCARPQTGWGATGVQNLPRQAEPAWPS